MSIHNHYASQHELLFKRGNKRQSWGRQQRIIVCDTVADDKITTVEAA